jgi:hypothetical protein
VWGVLLDEKSRLYFSVFKTEKRNNNSIQFNSIYLCAKLNSPEANYKVSTGKKMGRVRSKKATENNNILIKVII